MRPSYLCGLLALLLVAACDGGSSDGETTEGTAQPTPDAGHTDPDGAVEPDSDIDSAPEEEPPLDWQPCGVLNGQPDGRVECLEVDVPLLWEMENSLSIGLFVKRIRTGEPDGRSLWLLAGGPGQGGDSFEPLAAQLTELEPGLTIYMPDHRGTGSSTKLACPSGEAPGSPGGLAILDEEWPDCYAAATELYGEEGLRGFSTTEAALDLAWLIDRSPEERAFVLGVSYGTFQAYRYLQVAPDQAAGVIFDSTCSPGVCHLSAQDLWEDRVGLQWFDEVCAADDTCRAKLGDVPSEAVAALHADMEQGHCPLFSQDPAINRANLRVVLAQLMLNVQLRPAMAALVYRMKRCSLTDQQAIGNLLNLVFGGQTQPESYSWLLGMNIMVSELWEPDNPTPEEIQARYEETLMCRGVSNLVANQAPAWTAYDEPLLAQPVTTDTPTLMLQAEYDPATPVDIAEPLSELLAGERHQFIVVKHASHTVIAQSPLANDPTQQCGQLLVRAFLTEPDGPLPDCANNTLPPAFDVPAEAAQTLFGLPDLWENSAQ